MLTHTKSHREWSPLTTERLHQFFSVIGEAASPFSSAFERSSVATLARQHTHLGAVINASVEAKVRNLQPHLDERATHSIDTRQVEFWNHLDNVLQSHGAIQTDEGLLFAVLLCIHEVHYPLPIVLRRVLTFERQWLMQQVSGSSL